MRERYNQGVRSGDIIRNARLTSGLTQSELAQRAGLTQTQVSRLESGHGDPPFSTFIALIQAAGRDISLRLTTHDVSLHQLADDQRRLEPWERVRSLTTSGDIAELQKTVDLAAELPGGALITGALASVLQGGVYLLAVPMLELVVARPRDASALLERHGWMAASLSADRVDHLPAVGRPIVTLIAEPAGTRGYPDLRRDAVELPGVPVPVISVRDLLRIAERSAEHSDRDRRLELRAMLDLDDPRNRPDLSVFAG